MLEPTIHKWDSTPNKNTSEIIQRMFLENGEDRSLDLINWQYVDCPSGSMVSIAHLAGDVSDAPVALYAVLKNFMMLSGRRVVGAQSFDTLTNEKYRGRGLFKELALDVHKRMVSESVEVVYGIPNGSSYAGFQKHLKWRLLDPLPMLARPIGSRYARVLAKLRKPELLQVSRKNSLSCSRILKVPSDVTDLFNRSISPDYTGLVRDYEYLHWRLSRPGATYRMFESRDKHGKLLAFGAYELVLKHGCCLGYVMDVMVDVDRKELGSKVLKHMVREMKMRGADLVFAWATPSSPLRHMLNKSWFFPFPEKIRPIELHFGYRAFEPQLDEELSSRNLWTISYLDSDTV